MLKRTLNIVPTNFCYQEWRFISLIMIAAVKKKQLVIYLTFWILIIFLLC